MTQRQIQVCGQTQASPTQLVHLAVALLARLRFRIPSHPELASSYEQILSVSATTRTTFYISLIHLCRFHFKYIPDSHPLSSVASIQHLVLVSILVAAKFHLDRNMKNSVWSSSFGLPVTEIDAMEREFLGVLDYNLLVSAEEYEHFQFKFLNYLLV